MFKFLCFMAMSMTVRTYCYSQLIAPTFGKGLRIAAQDSSLAIKFGFRFQTLSLNEWESNSTGVTDFSSSNMIRRSRLKLDGYAFNPRLKFKLELALENRDAGSTNATSNNALKLMLDATINWNFYKNFFLRVGQGKLPGNRERVISSGNLQMVDRSRLNSRYTLDRDIGIMLTHFYSPKSSKFLLIKKFAISQGEGRNVTIAHSGGFGYTGRVEILPMGAFKSKGDYVGGGTKYEETPKFSLGITYDLNMNAARSRGQNGSFFTAEALNYTKNLQTLFVDFILKYQKLSVMGEYVNKTTDNGPLITDQVDNILGTYYTGTGLNLQAGYMLSKTWEVSTRYTTLDPDNLVASDETEYTIGLSKYIVGHKLKIQTDLTKRVVEEGNNSIFWRMQMDIHF